jgi:hypothetical protein
MDAEAFYQATADATAATDSISRAVAGAHSGYDTDLRNSPEDIIHTIVMPREANRWMNSAACNKRPD